MVQQRLKGRSVSPIQGVLIIAGIIFSIIFVSWLERVISLAAGLQYGGMAVWLIIVAEAVAVMRLSVMEFRYTVDDGRFFVERVYGDHARIVHDIPLKDILAVGDQDEIFKKYGNGQSYDKATLRENKLPKKAVAYRKDGADTVRLMLIQPEEPLLHALEDAAAANQQ